MQQPTALIVGVGSEQGLGAAISRRFAREGFHVLSVGRTGAKLDAVVNTIKQRGGSSEAVVCDATEEREVLRLFEYAMRPVAGREAPSVVVFNAGNNAHIPLRELSASQFEAFWRIGCYAGFLVGREAARYLVPRGAGTLLFTGASGSLRGRSGFGHFAAAKSGLRMLSQSMAREFGPQGIHVAHVVVDGGINGERLRVLRPEVVAQRGEDGLLDVDAIAENYWHLHRQPLTAWTQELDLRPFKEHF
ncbi:SDR family NAD(P)-dependent oxidoreductase [Pseudomonas sp. MAG733B]|jgi:NAD(P)-dependent dehydrogenase (short-subunit alcohol dehydrogenase family)|uniref:SDR family NAD(P)-dependent oxidoreductase n=1 Tax=Pseudomonas sp. MAG733B TaxID=3122079 RepID=UPI0030D0DF84